MPPTQSSSALLFLFRLPKGSGASAATLLVDPLPQAVAPPGAHTARRPGPRAAASAAHAGLRSAACPRCEDPCASSNASPPQNSISQPSIPHERFANTLPMLARRTSPGSVRIGQKNSMTKPHPILNRPIAHPLSHLDLFHRQRRKTRPQNHSPEVRAYSISIIPLWITATAAPAPSFLPPNRKRLATMSQASRSCRARGVSM